MRRPSCSVATRNEFIVHRIKALKADHPFWGYRRLWARLKYDEHLNVNKKRILRLVRQHDLLVKPNLRLKAKRTPSRSKPRAVRPNDWWGIDMTKVLVQSYGWVYIVLVLDWYTKKIIGYYAGPQAKTQHWLMALNMAVNRQFPDGARGHDVKLMSDNGCQPTSLGFQKACNALGITQAFTSYNNPKGNADTERVNRTLKEELVWLREWDSPFVFVKELQNWIEVDYNQRHRHQTLGHKTPAEFEAFINRQNAPALP